MSRSRVPVASRVRRALLPAAGGRRAARAGPPQAMVRPWPAGLPHEALDRGAPVPRGTACAGLVATARRRAGVRSAAI